MHDAAEPCHQLFLNAPVHLRMAAAISVIRKLNGGGDVSETNEKDGVVGRLPGLALREMDVVLGVLMIG